MSAVLVEDGPDKGAIWHFGEPNQEQKALVSGFGSKVSRFYLEYKRERKRMTQNKQRRQLKRRKGLLLLLVHSLTL